MMHNKTLGLLVLAILTISMMAWLGKRQPDVDDQLGQPVLPGLKEGVDQLIEVKIISNNMQTTLVPRGGNWTVAERDGYRVEFGKFAGLLDGLSGAKYEERKTSKPENFGVLELRDIGEASSKAVLVELATRDKEFALLIGTYTTGGRGQFVRHPQENQAWLVDRPISVTADPVDWLDPVIIDVIENEIVRVRQGDTLEAERVEEADRLIVKNLPEGKELRYPTVADDLARALTNVRLRDVRLRADSIPEDAATAWFHLGEGGEIVVNAWQEGGDYFLVFDIDDAEEQTEGRRIDAWTYQVSRRTFDKFTRTMEDMIKVEEEVEVEMDESTEKQDGL